MLFALLVLTFLLSGCYYINEGTQLFSIYGKATEIDKMLASGSLPGDEEKLLVLVKEIRQYAVANLALKENRNYTTYVRLDRDYLADVVSACASDSFKQYKWFYLFMGDLPYIGFFNKEDAKREVARLKGEGYDVYAREVDAFSTLGIFSDPVFSYMKEYSLYALASMLIHEQTHATLFLNSYVDFSENLASFVGDKGALLFIKDKDGEDSDDYKKSLDGKADYAAFTRLIHELVASLGEVYKKEEPKEEKLAEKERVIAEWKKAFTENYKSNFKSDRYTCVPEMTVNNALLSTMMNYTSNLNLFDELYERTDRDLVKMMAKVKELTSKGGEPFAAIREYLGR
jgi:predicted aminopeptidase